MGPGKTAEAFRASGSSSSPAGPTWLERRLASILECGVHGRTPGITPPFAPDGLRRILVVRNDNIGDVLCTTPALRALRRAFPRAKLAVLVPEHCRPVVERNPDVDDILSYTKSKHAPRWFGLPALWYLARTIRTLRRSRYDLAIVMRRPFSRSSAWLAYASGAPWRLGVGPRVPDRSRFFLNLGREADIATDHEVDGCLGLLAAIGIPAAGRGLTLIPDPDAQATVRRRLSQAGVAGGAGVALIHISNRREACRWPLPAFARAADALHERLGLPMVLSWAPGDETNRLFPGDDGKADEVAARMRTRPILLRTPILNELIAAVSLSDFVLSTDGGLMHIAAALGVPQVVIFGKTDASLWAPVSQKCVLLQRGGRADAIHEDEVVAAAVKLISHWGSAGANSNLRPATQRDSG
ncbi:MAG TPA: glycosyltransferase family 9 protein [Candidatus Acidoferrum sp.]|nr:glycosyltransferase family 9 protein [Candidatus Acidoferrum sp.]